MTKSTDRLIILQNAANGQCPRCGSKDLFESRYRLRQTCPGCQLPLEQEDGWGLGAIPLNYAITCLGWILPVGVIFLFGLINLAGALIIAGIGAIVIPFLTFSFSKSLWIGVYYAVLPNELKVRKNGNDGDCH